MCVLYCHRGLAGSFFFGVIPNAAAAREKYEGDFFGSPVAVVDNLDLDDDVLLDDDEKIEALLRNIDDADDGLFAAVAVAGRSVDAPDADIVDGRDEGGCALAGRAVDAPEVGRNTLPPTVPDVGEVAALLLPPPPPPPPGGLLSAERVKILGGGVTVVLTPPLVAVVAVVAAADDEDALMSRISRLACDSLAAFAASSRATAAERPAAAAAARSSSPTPPPAEAAGMEALRLPAVVPAPRAPAAVEVAVAGNDCRLFVTCARKPPAMRPDDAASLVAEDDWIEVSE